MDFKAFFLTRPSPGLLSWALLQIQDRRNHGRKHIGRFKEKPEKYGGLHMEAKGREIASGDSGRSGRPQIRLSPSSGHGVGASLYFQYYVYEL